MTCDSSEGPLNQECNDSELARIQARFSRRIFLKMAAKGLVAVGSSLPFGVSVSDLISRADADQLDSARDLFTPDERILLAAVQDHLLPSEPGSPGAKDIRATAYLEVALTGRDVAPNDLPRIKKGLTILSGMMSSNKTTSFGMLTGNEREKLLRRIEDTPDGEVWLRLVMGYTIEAYVGDPAYGGNTDGIVWAWLGHTPGFPRPPVVTAETRR